MATMFFLPTHLDLKPFNILTFSRPLVLSHESHRFRSAVYFLVCKTINGYYYKHRDIHPRLYYFVYITTYAILKIRQGSKSECTGKEQKRES